jgi:hypothetical protein
LLEGLLHLNRALHRINDAGELGQYAVAGSAEDPSFVVGDQRVTNLAIGTEGSQRGDLVRSHQPAIPLDIGGQDSGELAINSIGHGPTPRKQAAETSIPLAVIARQVVHPELAGDTVGWKFDRPRPGDGRSSILPGARLRQSWKERCRTPRPLSSALHMQKIDLAVERPSSDAGDLADAAQWHLIHEQPQDELVVENATMPARRPGRR